MPHLHSLSLISIEAAVAAFSQARAPGIYKGDYLKELFRRYGDEEDAPPAPELPEWCFDDDDGEVDDDGNAVGQESGPSSSGSAPGKRKKEKLKLVRLPGSSGTNGLLSGKSIGPSLHDVELMQADEGSLRRLPF